MLNSTIEKETHLPCAFVFILFTWNLNILLQLKKQYEYNRELSKYVQGGSVGPTVTIHTSHILQNLAVHTSHILQNLYY